MNKNSILLGAVLLISTQFAFAAVPQKLKDVGNKAKEVVWEIKSDKVALATGAAVVALNEFRLYRKKSNLSKVKHGLVSGTLFSIFSTAGLYGHKAYDNWKAKRAANAEEEELAVGDKK